MMARGKYLSLEEARKGETKGATIKRFCKEHPSEGDEQAFDNLDIWGHDIWTHTISGDTILNSIE